MISDFECSGGLLCEENLDYLLPIYDLLSKDLKKSVELTLISAEEMRELNLRTRGKDYATDVLSFPHDESFCAQGFLGSIAINRDLATTQAATRGHSLRAEISLLFIHAMLHLLGFDHERDNGEHRARERELIEHFALPASLIDRTLG